MFTNIGLVNTWNPFCGAGPNITPTSRVVALPNDYFRKANFYDDTSSCGRKVIVSWQGQEVTATLYSTTLSLVETCGSRSRFIATSLAASTAPTGLVAVESCRVLHIAS